MPTHDPVRRGRGLHVHVYIYIYAYTFMYITCININIDKCICMCVYIYIYLHTHIHALNTTFVKHLETGHAVPKCVSICGVPRQCDSIKVSGMGGSSVCGPSCLVTRCKFDTNNMTFVQAKTSRSSAKPSKHGTSHLQLRTAGVCEESPVLPISNIPCPAIKRNPPQYCETYKQTLWLKRFSEKDV